MAEISAAVVMKLRKMSGQGMMDCKKALQEADGDIEEAMALLRKKGLATLEKRASRDTTEGSVVCKMSDDGKAAVMATLCCETDFVAKSDDFVETSQKLADCCMLCDDDSVDNVIEMELNGKKFSEILTDMVSKTGEKTEVGDFTKYRIDGTGVIGTYVHFNNKLGAMVEIETSSNEVSCGIAQAATDVAMHVTAMNPVGVDRDSIDPAILEREREIAREQMKDKPANIIDKIVEGKLAKFFKDNCIVDQLFVKDDSKTVGEAVSAAAKAAGGEAKIKRFIRFEIG